MGARIVTDDPYNKTFVHCFVAAELFYFRLRVIYKKHARRDFCYICGPVLR